MPGAGVRWKHLHRTPESISKMKAAREKAQVKERKKQVKRAEKARRGEQRRLARYHERVEKWKEIKREEILEAKRTLMMYGDGDNLAEDMDEDDIDDYLDEFDPEEAYMMGLGGYSDVSIVLCCTMESMLKDLMFICYRMKVNRVSRVRVKRRWRLLRKVCATEVPSWRVRKMTRMSSPGK